MSQHYSYNRSKIALNNPEEIAGYLADKSNDLRVMFTSANMIVNNVIESNAMVMVVEGVDRESLGKLNKGLAQLEAKLKEILEDVNFMQSQAARLR